MWMAEIFLLPPWTVLKESGKATWKFIMHSSHIKVSYLFWFLELTLKKKPVLLSENVKRLKSRDIRGLEKNNHLMTDCLRIAAFLHCYLHLPQELQTIYWKSLSQDSILEGCGGNLAEKGRFLMFPIIFCLHWGKLSFQVTDNIRN